jgi:GNAT superfamily N-acetyltransferase
MKNFDMLVKLYNLPSSFIHNNALEQEDILIHRPMASDKDKVLEFVKSNFSNIWANECEAAFCNTPISCFIAVKNRTEIIGFSCYDASYRNYFGPIGVSDKYRGKNIGNELLLAALYAMKENGYAYGIIGWTSERVSGFYEKSVGAIEIKDSFPGIYKNALRTE